MQADRLAKNAIKDKPTLEPSSGYMFLEDVDIGQLVKTQGWTKAIVLDKNKSSVTVLVTTCTSVADQKFYVGKHRWAGKTEVKIEE